MKKVRTIVILIFIVFSNLSASNNWKLVDSINYEFGSIMRLKCYDSLNCMYLVNKDKLGGFHLEGTTDGGKTWKKVYMDSAYFHNMKDYHLVPKLKDLSYPNDKLCIAVGDSGLVLRSTDKGETWDVFRTDTNYENYSLNMYNDKIGSMAPFDRKLFKVYFSTTTDGGKTWDTKQWPKWPNTNKWIGLGHLQYLNENLFVGHTMYKFSNTVFNNYLIYVHNNWESWDTVWAPPFTEFSMVDENNVWISGNIKKYTKTGSYYYRQYIYHSSNGGHTWEKQWDTVLNKYMIFDIKFYDKNFGMASSRLGQMIITEDGGKTWHTEYITGEKPSGYERIADNIQIPDRNTAYVIYGYHYIYKWTRPTTSAAEQSQSPEVILTPNPATDYIDITVAGNRTLKDAVRVYDVLGNVVLSSPACSAGTPSEGGHIRLDVSGLAAGVYFVRVGGKMYKFVKM